MLEKILVPLDGSNLSEAALGQAEELAWAFGSEVHLLGVCDCGADKQRRLMQGYLDQTAESLGRNTSETPLKIRATILDGDPAGRVIGYACQERMGLLIVVSHGHSGIRPWTMGSTANRIVHGAPLPVLLLRAAAVKKKGGLRKSAFSKILLPLDGSTAGETALPYVLEVSARLRSEVTLLSVVESGLRVHTIGGLDFIRFPEEQVRKMRQEMSSSLDGAVARFRDRGVEARGRLSSGHAADEIIKHAKEEGASLVAMSSHGKSGLQEWVFGSVSNKVLHAGKSHLLLVKPAPTSAPSNPS
jgi:nucleotide-binding universal stress UspA family protein